MGKRSIATIDSDDCSTRDRHASGSMQDKKRSKLDTGRSSRLKYKHTSSSSKRSKPTLTLPEPLSLEGSISEEVLLRCLSFLSAHDLVTVSRVSSSWFRLSQDPQLWRSLYLRTYASAKTRRQAFAGISIPRSRPWKDLYKISTNWRNGTAKSSTVLTTSVRKAVLAPVPTDMTLPGESTLSALRPVRPTPETNQPDTLLEIYHQYFFSAIRNEPSLDPSDPPLITVSQTLSNGTSQFLTTFSSPRIATFYSLRPDFRPPLSITELRLDTSTTSHPSTPTLRLAVFYSTGQFSIFQLVLPTTSTPFVAAAETYTSLSLSTSTAPMNLGRNSSTPFDPIFLSRFHYPLLATCSTSFTLRFYQLSESSSSSTPTLFVREAETPLQSLERWAPVVFSLEKVRTRGKHQGRGMMNEFKVSLAYSLPVFPNEWTVGLQEFTIQLPPSSSPSSSLSSSSKITISSLVATSPPTHTSTSSFLSSSSQTHYSSFPFSSSSSSSPNSPRTRPSRRNPVTSIEYSNPFIVTSRTDNTIEVYRVTSSSTTGRGVGGEKEKLEIRHERSLFGHTARVGSVALVLGNSNGLDGEASSSTSTKRRRRGGGGGGSSEGGMQKLVSAGDDGSFRVWNLDSSSTSIPTRRREEEREGEEEEMIEIETMVDLEKEEEEEEEGSTEWQKLKKRRETGRVRNSEEQEGVMGGRPERIRKILVDEDKIVVLGSSSSGSLEGGGVDGGERIRVLRFD